MVESNFPDLTSETDRTPVKSNVQNADMPELLLVSRGITSGVARTNTGVGLTRRYDLRLVSGEMTMHEKLHPVEFAVFVAMERIQRTNKTLGLPFIKTTTLVDAQTVLVDSEANRGTRGWVTTFTIDIDFGFDLREHLQIGN